MIGGNALLGNALLAMGCDLDIWQFPHAFVSDEMQPRVRREITPADLEQSDMGQGEYQLIVVPLVLESVLSDAAAFFRRLRGMLSSNGILIIATRNQSRLDVRLAAALGKPLAKRQQGARFSFSWPELRTVKEYHREELIAAARKAGFRVRGCRGVTASRDFFEMQAVPLSSYVLKKGARLLGALEPFSRDTLLLELSPRRPAIAPWDTGEQPSVSVIAAAAQGGERLRTQLAALRDQTYPPERLELLIIHDGRSPDVTHAIEELRAQALFPVKEVCATPAEGPLARNLAMAQASGQVCAHTDALTQVTVDWVEAGAMVFDEDTGVLSGPVFADGHSCPSVLDLPGVQPEPAAVRRRREDLFHISNVFYHTGVALAAGGFNQRFQGNGSEPSLGWDTDLAWRLQREGWRAQFREEVCVFRTFPGPDGAWIGDHLRRASELPAFYAAVPEVAKKTYSGVFASRSTMYFDLMLVGGALALGRRRWPWLLLALPWAGLLSKSLDLWPPKNWGYSLGMAAKIGGVHLVWLAGLLKGSVRSRRPVL
ncbi:MAG: hypothetical protein Q7T33_03110 [Dehalococcoidia bacterium]|nr:hypothetical protein [Dehalococcoidia bacterium]